MENEKTNFELADNLMRLLGQLNFSDIRVKNHPEYPNPEVDHSVLKKTDYIPPLTAKKNDVIYYFEFIDGELSVLDKKKHPLRKLINLGEQQWDADFVLVTEYGNKDTVREWCEKYKLPVDQIWEM